MKTYTSVYFIGIGGIGMSALARYFLHEGKTVAGYDRTATPLTRSLEQAGVAVHYTDCVSEIPVAFLDPQQTLVVYTPAVSAQHTELTYFREKGFEVVKRSQILGVLSRGKYVMAVAGTHGKTTTTTMLAHFNRVVCPEPGSAFLGGISKNYDTNMLFGKGERIAVEADEFDRSFLQLYPDVAVVTSTDADHLDIYNDHHSVKESFAEFVCQIKKGGTLIYRTGIDLPLRNPDIRVYTYSLDCETSDFRAENLTRTEDGTYRFDLVCPDCRIEGCHLGIPGWINVENCIAATAMMWAAGAMDPDKLRRAMETFAGVKRRFDFYINTPQLTYMDDYAHHPSELSATLKSVRAMFPGRHITAIFQPHLFTRTRDFCDGFADSLSLCDSAVLLPIYPARELPIPGVSTDSILGKMTLNNKQLLHKEDVPVFVENNEFDILITFGAGDIDTLCAPIAEILKKRL